MRVRATPIDDDGNVITTLASQRSQIMGAKDCVETYTWSSWGTSDARVSTIVYSSATVLPGHTVTKTFAYTLSGGSYRLDTVTWSYS